MRKSTKVLALLGCAATLVVGSVMGTMAYLSSTTQTVNNTFTVGKVIITLDELDVDNSTDDADRDTANLYHLIPGKQQVKDPTVHVAANSENCFVYVTVDNNITEIETDTAEDKIEAQMAENGWLDLGVDKTVDGEALDVYYYNGIVSKSATVTDLPVFGTFTIDGSITNETLAGYATAQNSDSFIKVTAYAIQAEGFTGDDTATKALAAWNAGFNN